METITLTQASRLVNISRPTIYRMMNEGRFVKQIPGTKPPRWSKDAVIAWVEGRGA